MKIRIEQMREEHIPLVVALEHNCQLSSRGEASYLNSLQDVRSILMVASHESSPVHPLDIVGIFSGLLVLDELQIDNIAVSRNFRQKQIGAALLAEALATAKKKGALSVLLEVRASNFAARALYEKYGFMEIGRRKGYYREPLDDALVMMLQVANPSENAA